MKIYTNELGHMTAWPSCAYMIKTLKNKIKIKTFKTFAALSLFYLSLFILFCFSSLCQRVVLLTFLDIIFSQRERESPVVRGLSGGANLDNSRVRAYCACSKCGLGLFGHCFPRPCCLYSFSLSGRWADID